MTKPLKSVYLRSGFVLLSIAIFAVLILIPRTSLPSLTSDNAKDIKSLPDFRGYQNTSKKKRAFFEFLYPIVIQENAHIQTLRDQLNTLRTGASNQLPPSDSEQAWIRDLAEVYRLKPGRDLNITLDELLLRIDIIPPSLVLSQAAIESGWGTSRFAQQGNNLFGQWCFKKGCGLVPAQRQNDKHHEVSRFDSVNDSIRSYMNNLNSFPAYEQLRTLRAQSRQNHSEIDTTTLLAGLSQYSEQGQVYITKISKLIQQNNLLRYDAPEK